MACPLANVDIVKFSEELTWCIQQLERGLERQNPDSKQVAETIKIIKILKSSKAPLVKKRQAMRNALGDYRKKMKDEEKKSLSGMHHSKFTQSAGLKATSGSKFLRHSHSHQSRNNLDFNKLHIEEPLNQPLSSNQNNSNQDDNAKLFDSNQKGVTIKTPFHFIPSNNSFCFSFDDIGDKNSDLSTKEDESVKCTEANVDIKNSMKNDKRTENSSESTSFKFEKSDNSFSFGFDDS